MSIFDLFKNKKTVDPHVVDIPQKSTFYGERQITPGAILSAVTQVDEYGKLQAIDALYERLVNEDTNLDADIDTRTEALKAIQPEITTEITDAQQVYFDHVIRKMYPSLVEALIESKLKRYAFRQIEYELIDSLWYPKSLIDYKKLDLRIENRELVLYVDSKKHPVDELKFIKILRKKAILRSLLKYYTFKAFALTNWADFTEIFGKPMRKGTYRAGASKTEKDQLWDMLKNAGTSLAMMVSENVSVEFVDHINKTASSNLYQSLVEFCEGKSTKRILGQTVVTEQEKYGSEAKSKIANLVRKDILAGDARDAEVFISGFFTRLNNINFNEQVIEVEIPVNDDLDLSQELDMDVKLVQQIQLPLDYDYFYEKYGRPKPEKKSSLITYDKAFSTTRIKHDNSILMGRHSILSVVQSAAYVEMSYALQIVEAAVKDYKSYLKKLKNYDDFDNLSYPVDILRSFGEGLQTLIKTSYIQGHSRLANNNKHILPRNDFDIDWNMTSMEALHAFRAESFIVAGVHADETLAMLKEEAQKAFSQGTTFSDFRKNIKIKGFEPDNPYYVRTNYSTAINNSYLAAQWKQAEEQKDFFPYLRYICMFLEDSRQSHKELHGTIAHIDDPFWEKYYPPNDWNCACEVEQLTEDEARSDPMWGKDPVEIDLPSEWSKNTGKDLSIWGKWLKGKEITSMSAESLGLPAWRKMHEHDNMPFIYTADMSRDELIQRMAEHLGDRIVTDHAGFPIALPRAKADKFKSSKYTTKDIETRVRYLNHLDDTLSAPDEVWGVFADRKIRYLKKYDKDVMVLCEIEKGEITYFNVIVSSSANYAEKQRFGTLMK